MCSHLFRLIIIRYPPYKIITTRLAGSYDFCNRFVICVLLTLIYRNGNIFIDGYAIVTTVYSKKR